MKPSDNPALDRERHVSIEPIIEEPASSDESATSVDPTSDLVVSHGTTMVPSTSSANLGAAGRREGQLPTREEMATMPRAVMQRGLAPFAKFPQFLGD